MPVQRTRDLPSKPLEAKIEAPQPPTLTIISPTPRAFTFPHSSNTPYSQPSSPFEHEQSTLAYTPSPPPLVRTLSPTSPTSSISSTASFPPTPRTVYKRRKSTTESERRPKKGDEDYIKRPENAFILFRRKCVEERQQVTSTAAATAAAEGSSIPKKQRQAELSKMISQQWKTLSAGDRLYWEELAKQKKKEHEQLYPDYVYRPQRIKNKDKKGKKGSMTRRLEDAQEVEGEAEAETDDVQVSSPIPGQTSSSRSQSVSAPQPPQPFSTTYDSYPTQPLLATPMEHGMTYPDSYAEPYQDFAWPSSAFFDTSYMQSGMNMNPDPMLNAEFAPAHTDPSLLMPCYEHITHNSTCPSSSLLPPLDGHFSPNGVLSTAFSLPNDSYPPQHFSQPFLSDNSKFEPLIQGVQYEPCWQDSSLWSQGQVLFRDDFDVSCIPQVELGLPKLPEEVENVPVSPLYAGENSRFMGLQRRNDLSASGPVMDPFAGMFNEYDDMGRESF